jgi:osmotically-inducible protein OsmY
MRFATILGLCLLAGGCSRQDTDYLARIGRKLRERAEAAACEIGGKLDVSRKVAASDTAQRVNQRLAGDKSLAGARIEALGETQLELRGSVQSPRQRLRAVELAESTVGVEKVTDSLQLADPQDAR